MKPIFKGYWSSKISKILALKTSYFAFIFIIISCVNLSSQTSLKRNKQAVDGFYVHLGATQTSFLNRQYSASRRAGEIKSIPSGTAAAQLIYLPFLFEAELFTARFNTRKHPNGDFGEDRITSHRGINISTSMSFLHTVKFLIPYGGIGYESSSLMIINIGDKSLEEEEKSRVNTSAPNIKIGTVFKFNSALGLRLEYNKTVFSKRKTNHSRLTATLLYQLDMN